MGCESIHVSQMVQVVQSLKQARGLKFWLKVEEELYYPSSKNKGADHGTAQLICTFVFAYVLAVTCNMYDFCYYRDV